MACEEYRLPARIAALIWTRENVADWSESLAALSAVKELGTIFVGGVQSSKLAVPPTREDGVLLDEISFCNCVSSVFRSDIDQLLILTAPVLVPPGILDFSGRWMANDPRVAIVSFLTSGPGYLSFPSRNAPATQCIRGDTASSLTATLRNRMPASGPIHVPIPEGAAVLISRSAFKLALGFSREWDDDPDAAIAEFALRASCRGLFICLDAQTFVLHPVDALPTINIGNNPELRQALHQQYSFFPALYDHERESSTGPLATALDCARAAYNGLRILIDGSCLIPQEMGTQVQTVSLIKALAAHPSVQSVGVSLTLELPQYARDLLECPKVRVYSNGGLDFTAADQADILHRPFQPGIPLPFPRWQQLAKRVVITVLDLILYRIGSYHSNPEAWLKYRYSLAQSFNASDAIVAISKDVRRSIEEEQFGVDDRLFLVEIGTDHLSSAAPQELPLFMIERGWTADSFVLVLGTDYSHKNRDLAIRVWRELVRRGYSLRLVMAGASIPYASRVGFEESAGSTDPDIAAVPHVSSTERNWLLRQASVVLYPSSAEGFGLVPFEAATFGTPCVSVCFGPICEFGQACLSARCWDVEELANVVQRVLDDKAYATSAITGLQNRGSTLTWAGTADKLVAMYFRLLLNTPQSRKTTALFDQRTRILSALASSRVLRMASRFSRKLRTALNEARDAL